MRESSRSSSSSVTCARACPGIRGTRGQRGKPAGNREWQPEMGIVEVFTLNSAILYVQCGRDRRHTQSETERERERGGLLANQTHLKTVPSGPRHELSAMVKFMRRMQQQYVQQQRQQQRLYNKTKALQTEHSPPHQPPLTTWHTKSEKDEQGRLRRRFLQDFFMEYGLENNFMGNANATQTGKAFARLQLQPPALSAGPADAQCVNK